MLMQIPQNLIQDYLVLPFAVYLAIDNLIRYRKTKNLTSLQLCLATTYISVSMVAFGVPAAFTHDPRLISMGTFVGDVMQAASFIFLWFISIRAFLSHRPKLQKTAYIFVYLLTAALMAEAVYRDLTPPYGAKIIELSAGKLALIYNDTMFTTILYAVDSLALLILGIYFWMQAKAAPTLSQQIKIRSFAIGMVFITLAFTVPHAFPLEQQLVISTLMFSLFPISVGVGMLMARLKEKPKAPVEDKPQSFPNP